MQNKNALILFFLCCICATNSFSLTKPTYNGLYVGYALGSSIFSNKGQSSGAFETSFLDDVHTWGLPLTNQSNMMNNALIGSILFGYGYTKKKFYLGGEVAINASNYSITNYSTAELLQNTLNVVKVSNNLTSETKATASPIQFNGTLRTGYLFTENTLLFGRLGMAVANISLKTIANSTGDFNLDIKFFDFSFNQTLPTNSITANTTSMRVVPQIGGGLEQRISNHWTIRIDYIYSYYGRLQNNGSQTIDLVVPDLNLKVGAFTLITHNQAKLADQTVMIGTTCLLDLF